MKEAILAQLNSHDSRIRNQIASVVAAIASIEIPRKEWNGLIPLLCANSEHLDSKVRLTSLTTLGFICEEVDASEVEEIQRGELIRSLVNNLQLKEEIMSTPNLQAEAQAEMESATMAAIKALSSSISFAQQNFIVESQR